MMRLAIVAALLLTGCATAPMQYTPVVDRPGPTYDTDLAECRALAAQRDPVATAGAGAAMGAVAGAILGAAIGGRGGVALGARIGAGEGLVGGAAHGLVQQRVIVMSCLIGRGHRVIA